MVKNSLKMLVTEGSDNTKVLIDLDSNSNPEVIKKIEETLKDLLKEDYNVKVLKVSKEDLLKNIVDTGDKTVENATDVPLELGMAIERLALAFTSDKEELDRISNSIYVAYLMMKDEISLDKIMKYANFSMSELEIIKYYLIEKLKY